MPMSVAEWCETCGRRTLREVGACPECATKNVEASLRINQQLKSAIVELSRRFLSENEWVVGTPYLPNFVEWVQQQADV